jgi:hypothetical protein
MVFKKYLIFFIILFLSIFIYLNITFNRNKIDYKILEYKKNTEIFIDRDYADVNSSDFLNNKMLLQTTRHNNKKILLYTNLPLVVYRPTCPFNNNNIYGSDWNILKTNIKIKGFSCIHSEIYYKKFNGPLVLLNPGGPIASDPIFIKIVQKKNKIIILNKRK